MNAGTEVIYCVVQNPPPVPASPLVAVRLAVLGRGVVVQSLRHEMQRQRVFTRRRFLDFGPFVLEPDFDL